MPPVFRFAPSPNGHLHLGHAYSALLNADLARAAGGRLLLRIEDIDATRCRPEYEDAIYEDLRWLGLAWEEPVRRQSQHLDGYRDALRRLAALDLVYASFESRAEIARLVAEREKSGAWPRDPDGAPLYPGARDTITSAERERRIAAGEPYALRLDMTAALARTGKLTWHEEDGTARRRASGPLTRPDGEGVGAATFKTIAADPAAWGDVILARKETPTSYHFSVVVDDALQGVTQVVRGHDLYFSTAVHRLLQTLLDLPAPGYRHHPLMLDDEGRKLSKSTRATGLRELRSQGISPAEIRRMAGLD